MLITKELLEKSCANFALALKLIVDEHDRLIKQACVNLGRAVNNLQQKGETNGIKKDY